MESAVGMLPTAEKLKLALSNIQRHNKDTFGLYQAEASASQNLVDVDLHQNRISILRICLDGDFSTQLLISWYDKQISQRTAHWNSELTTVQVWVIRILSNFFSDTNYCIFDCDFNVSQNKTNPAAHTFMETTRVLNPSMITDHPCWGKIHMLIKALADSRSLHSYPCESRFSCPRSFGEHSPIFHKGPFCAMRNQRGAICYKCGIEAAEIVWNDYCKCQSIALTIARTSCNVYIFHSCTSNAF